MAGESGTEGAGSISPLFSEGALLDQGLDGKWVESESPSRSGTGGGKHDRRLGWEPPSGEVHGAG